MPKEITGVTLVAPLADPTPTSGGTFSALATYLQAGKGKEEDVSLFWEYATSIGGPYASIPASGPQLTTPTNPTAGADSALTHSATITAQGAGSYYLRIRAVGDSSGLSFQAGSTPITVTAGTNNLTAGNASSQTVITSPAVGQIHALTAQSITAATEITSATVDSIAGTDSLIAGSIVSASSISQPAIAQIHALEASGIAASAAITQPIVGEASNVVDLIATNAVVQPVITSPAVGQVHNLEAAALSSAASITGPTIGQVQHLTASSIAAMPEVSQPALAQVHNLIAGSVTAATVIQFAGMPVTTPKIKRKKHRHRLRAGLHL